MKLTKITVLILIVCIFTALPVKASYKWPFISQAIAEKDEYNLSESDNLPKALAYIKKYYVEPKRIDVDDMFKSSLEEVGKFVPEILVEFPSSNSALITIDNARKRFSSSLKNINDLWNVMKKILLFIELNYKGEVEFRDIESLIINGTLKTLDPHSAFLTPEFYKEFKIDTGGEFGGLGIVITSKEGQLTIIAPIEDTPAWKAGLKSGDVITQINDESTINMSLMKAVDKLRGRVGSEVALTVERKGRTSPFEITLRRAKIHIESTKSTLIKDSEGSVGYIKVKRFQKDAAKNFFKDLKSLQEKAGSNFKGLIIDLRNNPGGLLNEAVDIVDAFVEKGVIVSTVGANKRFIDEDRAHKLGTETKEYPIIVLVNEGSASASEIVAGALQSYKEALVIGQKTFGKGSVQSVYDLGDDFALKLTIAQYLTAGKDSIQTVGITPDIVTAPVTVKLEHMDLIPNKPTSEKELEKHLKHLGPTYGKKTTVMGYYKPYVDEEDLEKLRQKEYSNKFDFKDDFQVKIATRLILGSEKNNPKKLLRSSGDILERLEKQEEEKISAKLHEYGINWSEGTSGNVKLSTVATIKQNGKIVPRAKAGKESKLSLNITNLSDKPLYKLIGIVESENLFLNEKEFVFGKVKPGESTTRYISIDLPVSMNTRNIPYTISFFTDGFKSKLSFNSSFKVEGLKEPKFAFNYRLGKPDTVGAKHPLPRGKSVPVIVKIKNIGEGSTKDLKVYLSNKDDTKGIFIEKGRVDLGVLEPNKIKAAKFAFKVKPEIKRSTFTLELMISDRDFFEIVTTDLEITIESGAISPPPGIWYEGPEIRISAKNFPIISSSANYKIKGNIADDVSIHDYYIFVNDKKVSYKSNPNESDNLKFNIPIRLDEINNNITIIARDNNNLLSRKSFVIQKGK